MSASKTAGKVISCKAAIVWEFKKPVSIETIEVQPPGFGEVRIKMVAVGVCHSDICTVEGYMPNHPLPLVLGHEGAGVVESIGEGVTTLKPGDKVFAMFLAQCKKCEMCKGKRSNVCLDTGRKEELIQPFFRCHGYDGTTKFSCNGQKVYCYLGSSSFSEYTVAPENSCVKVDPRTPLDKACILACGFTTGYGSSANAVDIKPGDSTAVLGLGGVGLATVVGCKQKGASKIIGIDLLPEKEQIARKMGCTDFICVKNLKKPLVEAVQEMTGGAGVDFSFACIGTADVMENSAMMIKSGGTCVWVGISPESNRIPISPNFLVGNRTIMGSTIGNYKIHEDVPKIVNNYLEGKLPVDDFITHRYRLDQLPEAIKVVQAGKCIRAVVLM